MDAETFAAALRMLGPYLTERGAVEVDLAVARLQVAELRQEIAERDARIAQLEET